MSLCSPGMRTSWRARGCSRSRSRCSRADPGNSMIERSASARRARQICTFAPERKWARPQRRPMIVTAQLPFRRVPEDPGSVIYGTYRSQAGATRSNIRPLEGSRDKGRFGFGNLLYSGSSSWTKRRAGGIAPAAGASPLAPPEGDRRLRCTGFQKSIPCTLSPPRGRSVRARPSSRPPTRSSAFS